MRSTRAAGGSDCGGGGVCKRGDMSLGGGEVAAVPASGAANGLSNGACGAPAQTSNPLSRKLHKILETRLDNDKVARADPGQGRRLSGIQSPYPRRRRDPRLVGPAALPVRGVFAGKAKGFLGCSSYLMRFLGDLIPVADIGVPLPPEVFGI